MIEDIDELLYQYVQAFDENFPIRSVKMSEPELIKTLNDCLKTGKPYEFTQKEQQAIDDADTDI